MNTTKIQNASMSFYKMSVSKDNVFIGRVLVKNTDGIFPLVCFNRFTEKLSHVKKSDVIDVEGSLKDYTYEDYNGVTHFVKLILVTALSINGMRDDANQEEKEEYEKIWDKIKKVYQVLDVVEFERFSKTEGALEECYQ